MSCIQVRHTVLTLCVLAAFIICLTRYNINIAIVDMTNNVPPVANGSATEQAVVSKRYLWDQNMQGTILGASFWTYMFFQVPSGVFVEWFGSRWLVSTTILASGIINLVTPFITDCTALFIVSRLLLGMFQAGCFPACFALLVKWMPLNERSFAFSLLRVGAIIGSVFISLVSGFLCQTFGWPYVFYLPAFMSLVVLIVFSLLTRDNPADHPWITESELTLIRSGQTEDTSARRPKMIPWIRILLSPAVISYGVFKFALFWVNFTVTTKLPTYLNDVKGMDLGSNGVTNSLFNLFHGISLTMTGYLSDRVIERKLLSRTATRKAFSIVTGFGSASCILFVPFVSHPFMMHLLLYFCAFCMGASSGGDVPLPSEMSRNYPATIFSLINMISMISGFAAPSFAGLILTSFPASTAWPTIFISASATMACSTVLFLIFASANRQAFDAVYEDTCKETRVKDKECST